MTYFSELLFEKTQKEPAYEVLVEDCAAFGVPVYPCRSGGARGICDHGNNKTKETTEIPKHKYSGAVIFV